MHRVRASALAMALFLGAFSVGMPASAGPTAVKLSVALQQEILDARKKDARSFVNVSEIVAQAPLSHSQARARRAPVAPQLARLGPAATLPMLEKLTGTAESTVVRRDLIEALGLVKDRRAVPVLATILDDASEEPETTRTTAEALARIGTDDAADRLVRALSGASDARARALASGMGELRKLRVTEAIAARARAGDDAMVRVAARSLGRAGNAWAWKTAVDHSEEQKIRETAARALVDAFVAHEGEARDAASNALMVVDASITPALIADARASANPTTAAALDVLSKRFANNPTR